MKTGPILACAVAAFASSGCATIVSKSSQEITIASVPEGAAVKINNKSGAAVYSGNILFGGLIGLLAVDPATGAMYTLKPKEVSTTLDALKVSRHGNEQTLTVVLIEDVPQELVGQL